MDTGASQAGATNTFHLSNTLFRKMATHGRKQQKMGELMQSASVTLPSVSQNYVTICLFNQILLSLY